MMPAALPGFNHPGATFARGAVLGTGVPTRHASALTLVIRS